MARSVALHQFNEANCRIFKTIIPCIPTKNQHLIWLHSTKQFCLVGCIPLLNLFQGDQHTLDMTKHVLYACNGQISFGMGKKFSLEKNPHRSNKEDVSSSLFYHDDQLCVMGSILKMHLSILLPDLQVQIAG